MDYDVLIDFAGIDGINAKCTCQYSCPFHYCDYGYDYTDCIRP